MALQMSDLVERLRKQASDAVDWDGEIMQQWDKIRRYCETHKGSDLPRLMFEGLIENLAEHMTEAADRIEALEALVRRYAGETVLANTRIEALEAALQKIAYSNDPNKGLAHWWQLEARTALDKDAGK